MSIFEKFFPKNPSSQETRKETGERIIREGEKLRRPERGKITGSEEIFTKGGARREKIKDLLNDLLSKKEIKEIKGLIESGKTAELNKNLKDIWEKLKKIKIKTNREELKKILEEFN